MSSDKKARSELSNFYSFISKSVWNQWQLFNEQSGQSPPYKSMSTQCLLPLWLPEWAPFFSFRSQPAIKSIYKNFRKMPKMPEKGQRRQAIVSTRARPTPKTGKRTKTFGTEICWKFRDLEYWVKKPVGKLVKSNNREDKLTRLFEKASAIEPGPVSSGQEGGPVLALSPIWLLAFGRGRQLTFTMEEKFHTVQKVTYKSFDNTWLSHCFAAATAKKQNEEISRISCFFFSQSKFETYSIRFLLVLIKFNVTKTWISSPLDK